MRCRNTLVKRMLAVSLSVVVGLSGVNTSMAEGIETVVEDQIAEENSDDTGQEEGETEEVSDSQEGEGTTEEVSEKDDKDEYDTKSDENMEDTSEKDEDMEETPTVEPTETPVIEEQRETFDYNSAYQSLSSTWLEGTDSKRDQVVLSALKKVDSVKYKQGAGHTEDYLGLYGLTDVESGLYLMDNPEFLDDTGLVSATLRSGGFISESDWIASNGADFGSRNDLFSLVESKDDLLQGDIGIDTEGVVGIYLGNDKWVYSDYSIGWVELDIYGNRVFNQYWTLVGYSDNLENSSEKNDNQNQEGTETEPGDNEEVIGSNEIDSGKVDLEEGNDGNDDEIKDGGSTIEVVDTSEGTFDENGVEVKPDAEEPDDDSIEKIAEELDGVNGEDEAKPVEKNMSNEGTGDCYVSSAVVKDKIDGTTPFDSDNNPGNDSDSKNNIVRSFDTINYTLDYVTAIKGDEVINEAKLYVEFILPCSKEYAQFDMDTMKWMQDAKLQTTSKGNQILTGYRYLQNTGDTNMIPGAGTLSVGIGVKAAPNGTVIKPSFILRMEGNDGSESVLLTDETVVSAYPRYNIKISRNGNCDPLGWFDTNDGSVTLKQRDNVLKGRLFGYGIGLQLYNTTADKKLKGIELPTGDLTFDLTTSHSSNGVNMSGNKDYQVVLWDYKENESSSSGYLKRNMTPMNTWVQGAYPWGMPGNNRGSTNQFCYDGGKVSMVRRCSVMVKYCNA